MASFTQNYELIKHDAYDPIDPVAAFAGNFGKLANFYQHGNALANGVAVCDRRFANGEITPASGDIYFSYFTSPRGSLSGGIVTKVEVRVGAQAASGLSLAKVGLYTVSSTDQSLSLVASTASDTTGWDGQFSAVTKNLSVSYTLNVGTRYALAVIFVGTTPPNYVRYACSSDWGLNAIAPRLCGKLSGQSDLPANLTDGTLATTPGGPFATLLP